MIYKFYDLLISSYQTSASSEEPTESISFNYSKMEMEYKMQKTDGTLSPGVQFKYDLKANKVF
jgi:type VI secretion system secreted protein Hcp